jgi:ATP-dependent helicase HrpA
MTDTSKPAPTSRAAHAGRGLPRRPPGPPGPRAPASPGGTPIPPLVFPDALPVSARRAEIAAALAAHPVVIVCGETGSGKTTQLPKIALELGRGLGAGGRGLIGHTQPRRLAAQTVAKRIAHELGSPLGVHVGYKIRFADQLQPGASVKLMTDGILLAEAQADPLLSAYDTIIVDEAHERSLNIDFLLGYLLQLLPRRPDLKLVITSATIDAERFARHFAGPAGPAPVIQVSGRLYPVEVRYRPWGEDPKDERDLAEAIGDAVDELWRGGPGDVLVFLPGEREIRDCAERLRQRVLPALGARRHAEVLPLFSRLSQAEQERVFEPSRGDRIVLATNVAETSLTVPGVRYVVDTGTARIKRYSYRNKVEQLQVEPISQASANQRAGRCGRVADGVCIRLYGEAAFKERPPFTDPEILRASLAGVILRMKSLGLGDIERFPFVEPPRPKAIADGYALLHELGAVDERRELTEVGRALARLPLDPRIGRMLLAAREQQALAEVLVIAAALSVQDARERPHDAQEAADAAHRRHADDKSEFVALLKLWRHYHERLAHKKSGSRLHKELKAEFLNPLRLREWHDVHGQLAAIAGEQGWRVNAAAATYEQLHLALLAGLLGNVGVKDDEGAHYLGARGIKFHVHPGASLAKKAAGRWLMAAELVETTRLYARTVARIEPGWLERVGAHLLLRQLGEPQWDEAEGRVVAHERATLYGLPVYHGRRVGFAERDAAEARRIFIQAALVEQRLAPQWPPRWPFLAHNARLVRQVEALEHKTRRRDVLVDDASIAAFYDRALPASAVDCASFDRWWRAEASPAERQALQMTREQLMRHDAEGVTGQSYPKLMRLAGVDCGVDYVFEPGHARDGLTVTVPLALLNQIDGARLDWLVPGMLRDKLLALVKSLPQKPRARLLPLPEFVDGVLAALAFGEGDLLDRLLEQVRARTQLPVQRADFKLDQLPPHLLANVRVVDAHGRQLGMARNLDALKAEFGAQARAAFQGAFAGLAALKLATPADDASAPAAPTAPAQAGKAASPSAASSASAAAPPPADGAARFRDWSFGPLPELMELRRGRDTLVGFPALIDEGDAVRLEVFDDPAEAERHHARGLERLLRLQLREPLKQLERSLPDFANAAMHYLPLGGADELREQIVGRAIERAFLARPWPADAAAFAARLAEGRPRLVLIAQEVARLAAQILADWQAAQRKLKDAKPPAELAADVGAQLARLVGRRFVERTDYERLRHLPRYLKAVVLRIDKARADPQRDAERLAQIRPLEQRFLRALAERRGAADARLEEFRWLLEELRVSLFAQELRTPQPVSVKRLEKAWAQMQS